MQDTEFAFLQWMQEHIRCGLLDSIMPAVSTLGNYGMIWIILAVIMICTKKYRHYGIMLGISLLAGLIIGNLGLKNLVARPRPCWIDTDTEMIIRVPTDYSFPSGHTMAAAEAATVSLYADKRMGICVIVFAVLIAISRLYLYVHFPSDVIGGAILGTGISLMTVYFYRKKVFKQ